VERAYTLEVSSPGLERPLRHRTDYERFVGRLAKIVVREAVNGQMHFEGRLRGVADEAVELESGKHKIVRLPFGNIVRGRVALEFEGGRPAPFFASRPAGLSRHLMTNNPLMQHIEAIAKEKGIEPQVIVAALEDAMLTASRKHYKTTENLRTRLNPENG